MKAIANTTTGQVTIDPSPAIGKLPPLLSIDLTAEQHSAINSGAVLTFADGVVTITNNETSAAWDAAAAAFAALSPGKQALWEPVRQAVGVAIKAGNFALAAEIIQTVPTLYDGMDADRETFLALFA